MNGRFIASLTVTGALFFAGSAIGNDMADMKKVPSSAPASQPSAAVDLHNTVCPASGDKVEDSKEVEVYEGKTYHLCCASCHADFQKDPAKYAKSVAADPAKYGVK